jgi:hypothetical protein
MSNYACPIALLYSDISAGQVTAASSDPADVIPQSNMVLIIVPAFAHRPILE